MLIWGCLVALKELVTIANGHSIKSLYTYLENTVTILNEIFNPLNSFYLKRAWAHSRSVWSSLWHSPRPERNLNDFRDFVLQAVFLFRAKEMQFVSCANAPWLWSRIPAVKSHTHLLLSMLWSTSIPPENSLQGRHSVRQFCRNSKSAHFRLFNKKFAFEKFASLF